MNKHIQRFKISAEEIEKITVSIPMGHRYIDIDIKAGQALDPITTTAVEDHIDIDIKAGQALDPIECLQVVVVYDKG